MDISVHLDLPHAKKLTRANDRGEREVRLEAEDSAEKCKTGNWSSQSSHLF
jgi:hypothetical protein